jgi:hypothetical protein
MGAAASTPATTKVAATPNKPEPRVWRTPTESEDDDELPLLFDRFHLQEHIGLDGLSCNSNRRKEEESRWADMIRAGQVLLTISSFVCARGHARCHPRLHTMAVDRSNHGHYAATPHLE